MKDLLSSQKVTVCLGAGGVGKTTVSACLALAGARMGKKVLVMTIDPARRLANALGLQELGNKAEKVDLSLLEQQGIEVPGELHAMMLDHKKTFDDLVRRYSKTEAGAEKLLQNPWYQQMSKALIGVQDYMAVEKLYEMVHERDYDFVVLDTPPSSNAVDFMNAPHRMLDLLESEIVKWFHKTMKSEGSASRFLRWGSSAVFKALGKITGQGVLEEMLVLLDDLSELYDGLKQRAQETYALLRSQDCHFFIIASPQRLPLLEAIFFRKMLQEEGMNFSGFLLNRVKGMGKWENSWSLFPSKTEWKPSQEGLQQELEKQQLHLDNTEQNQLLSFLQPSFEKKQMELEQVLHEVDFLKSEVNNKSIGLIPCIHSENHELLGLVEISQVLMDIQFS